MALDEPVYENMIQERDVMVKMRDGVHLAVDVYRPKAAGAYPVLYTCAVHNKDLQRPEIAEALPPQPAYASLWYGVVEGGDTKRLVGQRVRPRDRRTARGGQVRGRLRPRQPDRPLRHDRLDHSAALVRRQRGHDRHLRVRRRAVPGGRAGAPCPQGHLPVRLHGRLQRHVERPRVPPGRRVPDDALPPRRVQLRARALRAAWSAPSGGRGAVGMGHEQPRLPDVCPPVEHPHPEGAAAGDDLLDAASTPTTIRSLLQKSEQDFQKIKIPFVCGSGAYAYTYKMHWQGAQHWFINAQNSPKKRLLFNGPAHMERPFHEMHDDIIRWYDHWLKGSRQRGRERSAGQAVGHRREQVAHLQRLAGRRDPVDQVLPR